MKQLLSILFSIQIAFLIYNSSPIFAQENTITLKNGTIIKGTIEGLTDGMYSVRTSNLGELKISASEISNINLDEQHSTTNSLPSTTQNPALNLPPELMGKAQELQQQILSDPNLFQDLQNLANDPEVIKLISDPNLMKDLTTMDQQKIENNENAQQLMNNPAMMELIKKLQQSK